MNQLDSMFNFQQTALRVQGQRQELLASNIANADTPNYKARDISFADTMKKAMGDAGTSIEAGMNGVAGVAATAAALPLAAVAGPIGTAASALFTTSPLHFASSASTGNDSQAASLDAQYRTGTQGSVDGNTVDGDV